MSYVVLARKWRPQSFADLIGQEHVSQTLANAIAADRVAHAFLFTGVRGVGKTTSARILAKALNCAEGPTAEPCLKCAPCLDIAAGQDVDVLEIDGATYTGIDNIRALQERLPYRPSRDRFKIVIVDEVHMLSNNAWNAFLKTLEEPPPHVKFIFATTEVQKVPITILSRCQRYDFKMITAQAVQARLRYVLDQEHIEADDAAIAIIAREAAGSMRDGMSLLDQVIAWAGADGQRLTVKGVAQVLGVAARSVLHRLAEALIDGDAAGCLDIVGELSTEGYDIAHVARDFLAHLRDLVVAKVVPEPAGLLDLPAEEAAELKRLAGRAEADDLTRLHYGFSQSFDEIARSAQPRAALEMTMVRLARRPALRPIDDLLRRLGELERRITGGGGGGAGPGPQRSVGAPPPARGYPSPQGGPPARRAAPRAGAGAEFTPPDDAEDEPGPRASSSPPPDPRPSPALATASPAAVFAAPARVAAPSPEPAPLARTMEAGPAGAPPSTRRHASARPGAPPTSTERASFAAPATALAVMSAEPLRLAITAAEMATFRAMVDAVRAKDVVLAAALERAAPTRATAALVEIAYAPGDFSIPTVSSEAARDVLASIVRQHFGDGAELQVHVSGGHERYASIAQIDAHARRLRIEAARREVAEHPLVTAAVEIFGAELLDVRLSPARMV